MRTVTRFGRILVRALPLLALGCTHRVDPRNVPQGVTLLQCGRQTESVAVAVADTTGDSLVVRGHTLSLPRGSLERPTWFRLEDREDGYVGVTIRPHGFRFRERAQLTLSYAQCESPLDATRLKIYYVDGSGELTELPSEVNAAAKTVTTRYLEHLSGYLVGSN